MKSSLKIFKIGGEVVDNPDTLKLFIENFSKVSGSKIIVHGGGKEATRLCKALEIPVNMIEGRRVTDARTLDVVTMVYAGLVNKRVVAALQSNGTDAIGLTGADGDVIKAERRNPEPVDYGFVGDISSAGINVRFIDSILESGMVPVFCAITHDAHGTLLNCNADSVASALACALASDREVDLIYCFNQKGVMRDLNDPQSIIPLITPKDFQTLKEERIIASGMIPKIANAVKALETGVRSVAIKHSDDILNSCGTLIVK